MFRYCAVWINRQLSRQRGDDFRSVLTQASGKIAIVAAELSETAQSFGVDLLLLRRQRPDLIARQESKIFELQMPTFYICDIR